MNEEEWEAWARHNADSVPAYMLRSGRTWMDDRYKGQLRIMGVAFVIGIAFTTWGVALWWVLR